MIQEVPEMPDCVGKMDRSQDSTFRVSTQGTYWIRAENLCGTFTDTVTFSEERPPSVDLPQDTVMCIGEPRPLNVSYPNSTYLWNTGSTDSSLVVTQSGVYRVSATNICGTDSAKTEVIYEEPINIDFGPDTGLCDADTLLLDATINTGGYHVWNSTNSGDQYTVRSSGTYVVRIFNACGVFGDTIRVNYEYTPDVNFIDDTVLCEGQVMFAEAPPLFNATYQWQDGSSSDLFFVNKEGSYWLEAKNRCGKDLDSFKVSYQSPPLVDLGGDQILCPGESILLDAYREGFDYRFLWQDGSIHSAYEATEPGMYTVIVKDQYNCESADSMEVIECEQRLFIPNSFSPNLDEKNEYWSIKGERLRDFSISIHNRWGQLVFESDKVDFKWDGTHAGTECPVGTYVYTLRYTDLENQPQLQTGYLNLIR